MPQPVQIATQVEPIQWVSLAVVLVIIVLVGLQIQQRRKNTEWLWLVPVLVWMLHALLFYSVLMIDRYGVVRIDVTYTTWSSILRLHGFVTVLATEAARWSLRRIKP